MSFSKELFDTRGRIFQRVRGLGYILAGTLVLIVTNSLACVGAEGVREFRFASVEAGRSILSSKDDFVQRMSAFDRKVRLQKEIDPGEEALLQFAAAQVLEWSEEEKDVLNTAIHILEPELAKLGLTWDDPVIIIKTTGKEEGNAAYTRGKAIVFPVQKISTIQKPPTRLFAHELFHVISRANEPLRDSLFELIGFKRVKEIRLHSALDQIRITNPDAPKMQHVIKLTLRPGESVFVTPYLFTKRKFATDTTSLFQYLNFKLLPVRVDPNGIWHAQSENLDQDLITPDHPDYWRQIRRNTQYIIHPEEIIADNFAMMLTNAKVTNTDLVEAIREQVQEVGDLLPSEPITN